MRISESLAKMRLRPEVSAAAVPADAVPPCQRQEPPAPPLPTVSPPLTSSPPPHTSPPHQVTQEDVREAIRLFQASTGVALAADHAGDPTRAMGFERPEHVSANILSRAERERESISRRVVRSH